MGLHYLLCFIYVYFSLTLTVHLKLFPQNLKFLFGSLECNKKKKEFIKTIYMSEKKYYNRMYQKCIYEIAVYTLIVFQN